MCQTGPVQHAISPHDPVDRGTNCAKEPGWQPVLCHEPNTCCSLSTSQMSLLRGHWDIRSSNSRATDPRIGCRHGCRAIRRKENLTNVPPARALGYQGQQQQGYRPSHGPHTRFSLPKTGEPTSSLRSCHRVMRLQLHNAKRYECLQPGPSGLGSHAEGCLHAVCLAAARPCSHHCSAVGCCICSDDRSSAAALRRRVAHLQLVLVLQHLLL